ncbi:MAG: response regulator transcription factor [Chloroflexales bacterium]|nr:response regulator transcription factor [Chloroflexales bacterium]
MSCWRIVVADDHEMIRAGLRAVLEQQLACEVVGEAATGAEAITLVRQIQPEILVTDMVMPGLSGLEVLRQVCEIAPSTRIVVFSMHGDDSYVREALRAGAIGYVLKESLATELMTAIRYAVEGRRYVSPTLSERMFDAYVQPTIQTSSDSYRLLNVREREVLVLTAQGQTSAEIAEQLAISPRTVEHHRATLMRKLGLRTIADVVRYAIRRGLITVDG